MCAGASTSTTFTATAARLRPWTTYSRHSSPRRSPRVARCGRRRASVPVCATPVYQVLVKKCLWIMYTEYVFVVLLLMGCRLHLTARGLMCVIVSTCACARASIFLCMTMRACVVGAIALVIERKSRCALFVRKNNIWSIQSKGSHKHKRPVFNSDRLI